MWQESFSFNKRALWFLIRLHVLIILFAAIGSYAPPLADRLAEDLLGIPEFQARADAYSEMAAYFRHERIARVEEHERVRLLIQEYQRQAERDAARTIAGADVEELKAEHEKLIIADLSAMRLYLYENGSTTRSLDIVSKGKRGQRWETPAGLYQVETKEIDHFSSIGEVHMPYAMQFFGNFFVHGWPYYPDGKRVDAGYSGGCIRLETADAVEVFEFAKRGTPLYVYDRPEDDAPLVAVDDRSVPAGITAESFIVADARTGRVYLERDAQTTRPIASITKLMTAVVGNETIHYDYMLALSLSDRQNEGDFGALSPGERLTVGEALYPLLMESNNAVAHAIARRYGTKGFLNWMNVKARAIGMEDTIFADASGISERNQATADDVFRLIRYLFDHQSFIFAITRTPEKQVKTEDGRTYAFKNFNHFASDDAFVGGKTGFTNAAGETMASLFAVPVGNEKAALAIVVLHSKDREGDTERLRKWFEENARLDIEAPFPSPGAANAAAAITTLLDLNQYRTIRRADL